jgi:hypothetical protein
MTELDIDKGELESVIDADVPCGQCQYNLRGLTPPGQCPECGFTLEESVLADIRRREGMPPPDPAWSRTIWSGTWLAIVSTALIFFATAVYPQLNQFPRENKPTAFATPGRVVLLALACSWWTLAWAAAWKLTTREMIPTPLRRGSFALLTRWLLTAYLLFPFLWAWMTWRTERAEGAAAILSMISLLGGLIGLCAIWILVGQIFRRHGHWYFAIGAWCFAPIYLIAIVVEMLGLNRRGVDSLSIMFQFPAFPSGSAEAARYLLRSLGSRADPVELILIAVQLWSVSLIVRLLLATRQNGQRG